MALKQVGSTHEEISFGQTVNGYKYKKKKKKEKKRKKFLFFYPFETILIKYRI